MITDGALAAVRSAREFTLADPQELPLADWLTSPLDRGCAIDFEGYVWP
jgi:hypothetical protein